MLFHFSYVCSSILKYSSWVNSIYLLPHTPFSHDAYKMKNWFELSSIVFFCFFHELFMLLFYFFSYSRTCEFKYFNWKKCNLKFSKRAIDGKKISSFWLHVFFHMLQISQHVGSIIEFCVNIWAFYDDEKKLEEKKRWK